MGKAIEPSEILFSREGLPKEKTAHINPQIRFLARFFDYAVFFLVLWGLHQGVGGKFFLSFFDHLIPLEFFSWIPFEALLLITWGSTPGKFLLRTKLAHGRKKKLEFSTAIKRSFNVWFRGLGMGIPIVNVLCMLVASSKLRVMGMTSWDREDNIRITHFPVARWRMVFASVVTFIGFFTYYSAKYGLF